MKGRAEPLQPCAAQASYREKSLYLWGAGGKMGGGRQYSDEEPAEVRYARGDKNGCTDQAAGISASAE